MAGKPAPNQQKNEREATRYEGILQRNSRTRKHEGKPVVTFILDYPHHLTKVRVRYTLKKTSAQGMNAKLASLIRASRMTGQKHPEDDLEFTFDKDTRTVVIINASSVEKLAPTLGEAWQKYYDNWLDARKKASAYNDLHIYDKHLKTHELHNRRLSHIFLFDLEKLVTVKMQAGYAPQSIVHMLGLIRRSMNRAIKWGDWDGPSPFNSFEMPAVDNERTRFLTEDELKTFLILLKGKSDRAWIMSLMAVHCGMRFGEIAKLKIRDIHFNKNLIFIRKPKNTHSRWAYLPDSLKEHLDNWLYYNDTGSPLVFPSEAGTPLWDMDEAFKDTVDEMKLNEGITERVDMFSFHCLRHTFASYLASDGHSLTNIATMLGQRDPKMANRYAHLLPSTQKAAALGVEQRIIGQTPEIQIHQ